MKIAILGGYGPSQSVGAVYRAFKRAGHDVWHVPTFPTFSTDDWFSWPHPDLLFTFKIGLGNVPKGFIHDIPRTHKVFWSFDDPHWIDQGKDFHWAAEHDVALTSCYESVTAYRAKGLTTWFLPPAMDTEHYRDWKTVLPTPDWHLCSFICTNLYPKRVFPNNFIERSEMIDRLTRTFGKDFALYGFNPEIEAKPRCLGQLKWEDSLPQAIQYTKMNIENHAINNKYLYFNERFFQIAATRRAMFLDRCNGFEELFGRSDGNFIWYSSLDELTEKLIYYKDKDESLLQVGERGYHVLDGWTYDEFVKQVLRAAEGKQAEPTFL